MRNLREAIVTLLLLQFSGPTQECDETDIRLVNDKTPDRGVVEICLNGVWGSVCHNNWDLRDAAVVCRQLGYDGRSAPLSSFNLLSASYHLGDVNCSGTEERLSECSHSKVGVTNCMNINEGAGVQCKYKPRCADSATPSDPLTEQRVIKQLNSHGDCSVYTSETGVCDGIMRLGIDYVYASSKLGNQSTVAGLLNEKRKAVETVIAGHDESCVQQVFTVLCHFYLPRCGNATHFASPSTICPKQCHAVQERCKITWNSIMSAFATINPVINCDYISQLLSSVPHCCTKAGLGSSPLNEQSPGGGDQGDVATVVVGVLVLMVLAVVAVVGVVLLIYVLCKRYRRKLLQRMHLDILAIRRHNVPVMDSQTGTVMRGPSEKRAESITGPNCYSSPVSSSQHGHRVRVQSFHMRELAKGKFVVKRKDITLLDCIGEGEFGIVYKATLRPSRDVAVKTLKGEFDQIEIDRFVEECLKMSSFKHAHVMGLIGICFESGSTPFLIMPYMANGSLLRYLRRERNSIVILGETEEDELVEVRKRLMVMCCQIASGMQYLAASKYIHRDLAARNCMIDAYFLIKITDFGLSEDVFERNYFRQNSSKEEGVKLPVKWMAPESLSDGHFSEKSDVWSYGVTMWEIFSGGKTPYPGTTPLTVMQTLEQGHRMPRPYNTTCSEEIYGIMRQCWETVPEDRPTFEELYSIVSKCIERMAGYLEIGYNPFISGEEKGHEEEEKEEKEKEKEEEGMESTIVDQVMSLSEQTGGADSS